MSKLNMGKISRKQNKIAGDISIMGQIEKEEKRQKKISGSPTG